MDRVRRQLLASSLKGPLNSGLVLGRREGGADTLKGKVHKISTYEDMEIFKRTERLFFRAYDSVIAFPNVEKFRLAQKITNTFLELLSCMSAASDVKSKRREFLSLADGHLRVLKLCFRLARHKKYIGKEFGRQIAVEFTEIGKMLSAWIKSSSR